MPITHGRSFIRSSNIVDGKTSSGYLIKCQKCSNSDVISNSTRSGSLPPEVIEKKFAQKGWRVGHRVRDDQCPACIAKELKVKKRPPKPTEEAPPPALEIKMEIDTVKAEAPPEITKEDRRIIFGEIDSHYIDEMRGYDSEWNDARIAESLKVPLAWVRQIREDNFGPEMGESVKKDIEEAKVIIAKGEMVIGNLNKALENVSQSIQSWKKIQDGFEREVTETRRAIEDITKRINNLTKK